MPSHDERTLQVLQKIHNELQRYYILLRLIRADLEKITKNFAALSVGIDTSQVISIIKYTHLMTHQLLLRNENLVVTKMIFFKL